MQHENGDKASGPRPSAAERSRDASESDQTLSDSDQTAADADQTASDANRTQSQTDQRASDRDQAAADRDLGESEGTDELARTHASSRADRKRSTIERDRTSISRFRIASDRDEHAAQRDVNSMRRDTEAEARDRAAEQLDQAAEKLAQTAGETNVGMSEALAAAARARDNAAANRARAGEDRERAAADRMQAAADRQQATIELERAHLDALTGAYQRGMGEVALGHELARAQRAEQPLVLAFIDVDGLKAVNDGGGHAAGDALLQEVSTAIQAKLRSYDPLVRMGGDEFVCALADATLESAAIRFAEVNDSISNGTVTVGLSEMRPDDSLTDLIRRSDGEMRRLRAARPSGDPRDR